MDAFNYTPPADKTALLLLFISYFLLVFSCPGSYFLIILITLTVMLTTKKSSIMYEQLASWHAYILPHNVELLKANANLPSKVQTVERSSSQ